MFAHGFARAKAAFNKDKNHFTKTLVLNLRMKPVKCYIWSIALFGAETLVLRKIDQKCLESFQIWRGLDKISWTGRVRNEAIGATEPHKPHHSIKVCIPSEGTHTACNIPVVHKCLRV